MVVVGFFDQRLLPRGALVRKLVSVYGTSDVAPVRIAYAEEIEQCVKMDFSSDPRSETIAALVDSLEAGRRSSAGLGRPCQCD